MNRTQLQSGLLPRGLTAEAVRALLGPPASATGRTTPPTGKRQRDGRPPNRPRERMQWLAATLRRQGLLNREIAERLEVHDRYISELLPPDLRHRPVAATLRGKGGAWPRDVSGLRQRHRDCRVPAAKIRQVVALRRQGLTISEVVRRTGVARSTVHRHLPPELRRLPAIEAQTQERFRYRRVQGVQLSGQ